MASRSTVEKIAKKLEKKVERTQLDLLMSFIDLKVCEVKIEIIETSIIFLKLLIIQTCLILATMFYIASLFSEGTISIVFSLFGSIYILGMISIMLKLIRFINEIKRRTKEENNK